MVGASGELAQLGERQLCKLDVAGSIPAFSTAAMRRTKGAHEIRIRDTHHHHIYLHLLPRQLGDARGHRVHAGEDQGLQASKSAVLARDGSSLGKTEVRWEGQADRRPYSDVTIRVTREPNEFAVGQASTKADYDHVFDAIRKLGRL